MGKNRKKAGLSSVTTVKADREIIRSILNKKCSAEREHVEGDACFEGKHGGAEGNIEEEQLVHCMFARIEPSESFNRSGGTPLQISKNHGVRSPSSFRSTSSLGVSVNVDHMNGHTILIDGSDAGRLRFRPGDKALVLGLVRIGGEQSYNPKKTVSGCAHDGCGTGGVVRCTFSAVCSVQLVARTKGRHQKSPRKSRSGGEESGGRGQGRTRYANPSAIDPEVHPVLFACLRPSALERRYFNWLSLGNTQNSTSLSYLPSTPITTTRNAATPPASPSPSKGFSFARIQQRQADSATTISPANRGGSCTFGNENDDVDQRRITILVPMRNIAALGLVRPELGLFRMSRALTLGPCSEEEEKRHTVPPVEVDTLSPSKRRILSELAKATILKESSGVMSVGDVLSVPFQGLRHPFQLFEGVAIVPVISAVSSCSGLSRGTEIGLEKQAGSGVSGLGQGFSRLTLGSCYEKVREKVFDSGDNDEHVTDSDAIEIVQKDINERTATSAEGSLIVADCLSWLEHYVQDNSKEGSGAMPKSSSASDAAVLYFVTDETIVSFVAQPIPTHTCGQLCSGDICVHRAKKDSDEKEEEREKSGGEMKRLPSAAEWSKGQTRVAGLSSVLRELEAVLIPPLLYPELYRTLGVRASEDSVRPPRGVLLYGSAGVGKTSLAEQIGSRFMSRSYVSCSEDCSEGIDFMESNEEKSVILRRRRNRRGRRVQVKTVRCGSVMSSVVGDSERMLSSLFNDAEKVRRSGVSTLLILDDVHLICPRRGIVGGTTTTSSTDRVAATLLALMDGIGTRTSGKEGASEDFVKMDARGSVVILAITSNPSVLDPAIRRPGRLDFEVEVPIPDDASRAEIIAFQIRHCLRDIAPNASDDDVLALARYAKGFTGADTLHSIKEAAREVILRWKKDHDKGGGDKGGSGGHDNGLSVSLSDIRNAISRTNPSSIRGVAVEVPSVRWSDIGGMNSVKRLLREAVELPFTHGHIFKSLGVAPPRGVLLFGPPGCSKTLMARALATEGGMNFLAVKGPELLSKWLGESERALASLFRRARQASPCVIFFDEIDAIASKRGGSGEGGSSGGERLLSQLLTELDGISSWSGEDHRVVVVGATNRPDLLDTALTRPGRVDRMIYVGVPDDESRESILRLSLKRKCCFSDIDIPALAKATDGFSGAELVALCRDAALRALEEEEEYNAEDREGEGRRKTYVVITMRHLLESVKGTKCQITPEMLQFYENFRLIQRGK